MFSRFLPKEFRFFDLFDQHAACVAKSAKTLLDIHSDGSNIPTIAKQIHAIEHEADTITHRCIELLHQTFITPLDRDDIFRLISTMDDVIDFIDAASDSMDIYKVSTILPPARRMAEILVAATQEMQHSISLLRDLKNQDTIREHGAKISQLESENDGVLRAALGNLFENEADTRTVIKWKEIYDNLESAVDSCNHVANIMEGIILEYA